MGIVCVEDYLLGHFSDWGADVTAVMEVTSRACWYSDSLVLESSWLLEQSSACFPVVR